VFPRPLLQSAKPGTPPASAKRLYTGACEKVVLLDHDLDEALSTTQHHLMTSSSQLPIAIDRASGGRAGGAAALARAPFSHKQRSIRDFKFPKINANSQRPKTADATKFRWRRSIP
jgi:hypothetical protein